MNLGHPIKNLRRLSIGLAVGFGRTGLLAWSGSPILRWSYLAALVVVLLTLAIDIWRRATALSDHGELLSTPLFLAHDQQILDLYRSASASLREVSAHFDPIYRDLALQRTEQLFRELADVARGRILFSGTETWQMSALTHRYTGVSSGGWFGPLVEASLATSVG